MKLTTYSIALILLSFGISCQPKNNSLKIAVASNFLKPCKALVKDFKKTSNTHIEVISASTGKLSALIQNGANYDIFLAADLERPKALAQEKGLKYFNYAYGRLAIWNKTIKPNLNSLQSDFEKIAIANPSLAPYGKASKETLTNHKSWEKVHKKIIYGENVNQAYIFAKTDKSIAAFIPLYLAQESGGFHIEIPKSVHSPITQAGIRLSDSVASKSFENYLKSNPAKAIIKSFKYGVSND